METTIHIVTKIQSDYDYYNPTVLFATDNILTAESYALKGNRVLPILEKFYLNKVNMLTNELNWEKLTKEVEEYYNSIYEIYNDKYESYKRTKFRVTTVPLYMFKSKKGL